MRRGSREFECRRQLDFGYDISQKNTRGNAVKAFRISETPFFEPSAMYNNNQTLLDVYDIRAREKIKKLPKSNLNIEEIRLRSQKPLILNANNKDYFYNEKEITDEEILSSFKFNDSVIEKPKLIIDIIK